MAKRSLPNAILDLEYQIEQEEKRRFLDKSAEDEIELIGAQENPNTSKKTSLDLKCFQEFLKSKNERRDIAAIPAPELDRFLANFIISVRKTDGTEYEPDSLTSKVASIGRYLRTKGYKDDIKTSVEFQHSRQVLEAKRKELKSQGRGNRPLKSSRMELDEVSILKEKGQLGTDDPRTLQNSLWLLFTMHFGLRSVTPHTNLLWGDVQLKVDCQGVEYLEFNERTTKTRSGKTGDTRPFPPKAFANSESDLCPVHVYKEFRRHRPAAALIDDARMYLQPMRKIKSEIWYTNQPLGKNSIGNIVKHMYQEAGIGGRHTNHSVRRTLVSTALESGIHETRLMQLTGHKNVNSLNEYRTLSLQQQQEISTVLSDTFSTTKENAPPVQIPETATSNEELTDAELLSALDCFKEMANQDSALNSPTQRTSMPSQGTLMPNCVFNGPVYLNFNNH